MNKLFIKYIKYFLLFYFISFFISQESLLNSFCKSSILIVGLILFTFLFKKSFKLYNIFIYIYVTLIVGLVLLNKTIFDSIIFTFFSAVFLYALKYFFKSSDYPK